MKNKNTPKSRSFGRVRIILVRLTEAEFQERIKNAVLTQKELNKYKNVQTKTTKGKSIKLYCNIGNHEDVDDVLKNTGEGIGLFRSDFCISGQKIIPTKKSSF